MRNQMTYYIHHFLSVKYTQNIFYNKILKILDKLLKYYNQKNKKYLKKILNIIQEFKVPGDIKMYIQYHYFLLYKYKNKGGRNCKKYLNKYYKKVRYYDKTINKKIVEN